MSRARTFLTSPKALGVRVSKVRVEALAKALKPPWSERPPAVEPVLFCWAPGPSSESVVKGNGTLAPPEGKPALLSCIAPKSLRHVDLTTPYTLSDVLVPGMRKDCGKEPAPGALGADWALALDKPTSNATVAVRLPSAMVPFKFRVVIGLPPRKFFRGRDEKRFAPRLTSRGFV